MMDFSDLFFLKLPFSSSAAASANRQENLSHCRLRTERQTVCRQLREATTILAAKTEETPMENQANVWFIFNVCFYKIMLNHRCM
jgi:lysozyme family protein